MSVHCVRPIRISIAPTLVFGTGHPRAIPTGWSKRDFFWCRIRAWHQGITSRGSEGFVRTHKTPRARSSTPTQLQGEGGTGLRHSPVLPLGGSSPDLKRIVTKIDWEEKCTEGNVNGHWRLFLF